MGVSVATVVISGVASGSASARTPNDPSFSRSYGLHNTGQSVNGTVGVADADIDAPEAWDVTTGSASVTVAMIDDGVDFLQADLAPNLLSGGYDYGDNDSDPTSEVGSNHGTQTASLVGARGNNGLGIPGVDWTVGILPLKVRKDGPGERFDLITPSAVAAAFRAAGARGIRVASASFGLRSTITSAEQTLVRDAVRASPDTLFVVSAGNSARSNDTTPRYPCNLDAPNLLCVGSSDQNDALASFSNYGAKSVHIVSACS